MGGVSPQLILQFTKGIQWFYHIDVIVISTLYLYILEDKIAVSLKLNIVSYIPGNKMESILYPWK